MLNSYGPEDKDALYKRYIKNYKKGRMLIAGFLSSFVWFLLIFLSIVFMISDFDTQNINETLVVGILIGGIVLFVVGAIFIIRFFIKLPARRLKSFAYIEKVEYFEIVNMYSKNKNPKNIEYCLFERR